MGPLPTFPENFMQIRSKLLRKVANRQVNKQRRKHKRLGGGNYSIFKRNSILNVVYERSYLNLYSLVLLKLHNTVTTGFMSRVNSNIGPMRHLNTDASRRMRLP